MGLFSRGLTDAERARIRHELGEFRLEGRQARDNFERCVEQRNAGGAEAWATRMLQADNASVLLETLLKEGNKELLARYRAAFKTSIGRSAIEALWRQA